MIYGEFALNTFLENFEGRTYASLLEEAILAARS